jgi:hypothetical protein
MIWKKMGAQIAATGMGLLVLAVIVTCALDWTNNDTTTLTELLVMNALAACFAILTWSGILSRSKGVDMGPTTWSEWLLLGIFGLPMALFFLWLDCGYRLPTFGPGFEFCPGGGFSVALTFAALGMTAVSIPSAIRAWMLARFNRAD